VAMLTSSVNPPIQLGRDTAASDLTSRDATHRASPAEAADRRGYRALPRPSSRRAAAVEKAAAACGPVESGKREGGEVWWNGVGVGGRLLLINRIGLKV
jgi:hypothetical protein